MAMKYDEFGSRGLLTLTQAPATFMRFSADIRALERSRGRLYVIARHLDWPDNSISNKKVQ